MYASAQASYAAASTAGDSASGTTGTGLTSPAAGRHNALVSECSRGASIESATFRGLSVLPVGAPIGPAGMIYGDRCRISREQS